jgi:predicted methyltransferase
MPGSGWLNHGFDDRVTLNPIRVEFDMAGSKLILSLAMACVGVLSAPALAQTPSSAVIAAVADPGRPEADRLRDADRKPAEAVALSGLKPGDTVAELASGGGYYTRILAKVVGPQGKVYAVVNAASLAARPKSADAVKAIAAADPAVVVVPDDYTTFAALPQKVDMVWTTENYHDFHNALDMAAFDKAVFNALKPGGIFFVEDHAAAPGAGATATSTLHRIDPATVLQEVTAAGFKLARGSDLLKNPADTHLAASFDPSIRGHTDRFIMVFRKP